MAVRYLSIDREFVSRAWHVFLTDARKAGVDFNINEGKRSLSRQWYFWRCGPSGCCCCNDCNLAAFPSPWAPHIRVGRLDHAIDTTPSQPLIDFGARHGVTLTRAVASEDWHLEARRSELLRYAREHKHDVLKPLGPIQRRAVETLLRRRRKRAAEAKTGKGPKWRKLDRAVGRSHKRVEGLYDREKRKDRRNVLHRALRDRDGRLP